jgi:translocation and assembly module TamB
MTLGAGRITLKGVYRHSHDDWSSGQIQFETASHGLTVQQFEHLRARYQTLSGQVDWKAGGKLQLVKGDVQQSDAAAELSLRNASFKGRPYGSLTLTANTHDAALDLHLRANLNATSIEGSGQWRLEGDYPGHGQFSVPHITIAAIHDLLPNPARKELPFEGFVEGTVDVEGPLLKFDEMRAQVRLNTLQINASAGAKPQAGAQARDLVLRSAKPILLEATTKRVDIRSAVLAGTGTSLSAEGHLSLDSLEPYNLRFQGSVNLAVLQIFNRNLLGSGVSEVNATVRGALDDPDVEGRLSLKNASLYLKDLPNGLDQANGLILFDRNRATVDSLTALTGAGTITLQKGSFVGFRGNTLLYRVQATADHVRYRSPEGISLTVNAALGLNGTSESSVLSGTVTVIRAGFNPTTDLGSLLASTTRPVSAPAAPNEYLQGVQFDVRIDSAQALEIQTSLTRNIEADVNLRIRGTPDRPIVLGNLSINQGEIEFFGNRYAINRGDMNFYNPAKIEPIIDMDLQTSVRGVTVDVSFTGPLNKLNFSYRSDPPLQTGEIIALLAVGRDPNSAGTLAAGQNSSNSNYVATGNNELLAQAISQPNQGRLQRFFGVGHIKIDPQITDVTAIPQARLTFEQQVSKDVTMTYITNLARTQEQIIRVEWDFSSQWSAIALRDENGAFGIDFQYRKRFK